ncbi:MAG: hypothetical protein K2J78_00980, partial [Muribaculaceae bacterium]|nr:hypothetical protein [Muribaculaceae bacterium]
MFSILHKIHLNAPPLLSLVASMLATLLLIPLTAAAHSPDSLRYETEVYATSSTGKNTPFWLLSNRQGLGSPKRNFGYARAAIFKDIDKSKRFSWGAGVDLVGAWRY